MIPTSAGGINHSTETNKNVRDVVNPLSLSWGVCFLPSDLHTPGFPAMGLKLNYTPAFPILQFANGRLWDLATLIMWASSYNKSPLINRYTSYWFCFSGESCLYKLQSPFWYRKNRKWPRIVDVAALVLNAAEKITWTWKEMQIKATVRGDCLIPGLAG